MEGGNHDSTSQAESLNAAAEYGKLPFDRFVLDHWDYSRPSTQDQQQWNELARTWLSMDRRDRKPYWIDQHIADQFQRPTQDTIDHVLAPFQTIRERNVSEYIANNSHDPVWLRTCYKSELVPAYEEIVADFDDGVCDARLLLDDETLYGQVGDDWAQALLRLPLIPDTHIYEDDVDGEEGLFDLSPPDEDLMLPLYDAALKEKSVMYLLDEEALREKVVKVLWLDVHGNCVWRNTIRPDEVTSFEARPRTGGTLWEFLERSYNDPTLFELGALIEYD